MRLKKYLDRLENATAPYAATYFAVWRIFFGTYLAYYFLRMVSYASEIYSNESAIANTGLPFQHSLAPSIPVFLRDASDLTYLMLILAGLSLCIALGIFRRSSALIVWYCSTALFNANPLTLDPSLQYVGWLLLAITLVPLGEGFSIVRARDKDWYMPASVYFGALFLAGITYSISGFDKLLAPSWVDGHAIRYLYEQPIARDTGLVSLLLRLPDFEIKLLTWLTAALQLCAFPLLAIPALRPYGWMALTGMFVFAIATLDLTQVVLGVLLVHAFIFNTTWIRTIPLIRSWGTDWFPNRTLSGIRDTLINVISGILTSIGMFMPQGWILSIIGIALFAHTIFKTSPIDWRSTLRNGWMFGFASAAVPAALLWTILPLDWIGSESPMRDFFGVGIFWLYISLAGGVFFALFSGIYMRFAPHQPILAIVFAASLWTVVQYAQTWGISFLTGSPLSAHITALVHGYALSTFTPALSLAPYGGVYLMTFALAGAGFIVRHLYTNQRYALWGLFIGSILLVGISGFMSQEKNPADAKSIVVAAVTTYIPTNIWLLPEETVRATYARTDTLVESVKSNNPQLIIFPEGVAYYSESDTTVRDARKANPISSALLDSTIVWDDKYRYKRMNAYAAHGELVGSYDKISLMPLGERAVFSSRISWLSAAKSRWLTSGTSTRPLPVAGSTIGALFCFEALSPVLHRDLTANGADVLVNLGSQSWFHGSWFMQEYMRTMLRVRAAENDRFLVAVNDNAPSVIISNTGAIIERAPAEKESVLVSEIPLRDSITPFVRWGERLIVMPSVVVLLCIVYSVLHRRRMRTI